MKPLLLLLCLSFFFLLQPSKPDVESDRRALSALRAAVGGRSLLWNLSTQPCLWTGVICNNDQKIVELRFPGMGLSGTLPVGVFGNLTTVQTISLRFNALTGQIPPDMANASALRNLYLQGNSFSGEIPSSLFSLQNLVRLNLAFNLFTGSIPSGLNTLTRLKTLYLEQNRLTGSIPDLTLNLDQFNVSFNNLTGQIPARLSRMPGTAFLGTSLCGSPLKSCNGESGGGRKLSGGAIAGIVIGSVLGLLSILLVLILLCRRKTVKEEARDVEAHGRPRETEIPSAKEVVGVSLVGKSSSKRLVFFGTQKAEFDLEDLLRASAEVLGKGTFGTTYKAALETGGVVVAVKRVKDVAVPEKEFRGKMKEIGEIEHQNLVPLRAYYYNTEEKLLVYDYLPTGSLSALLHGNTVASGRTPLNWDTRSSIALGAARAIAHLHSLGPTMSHGNIKSSNILLTRSYEPRVSDFGLAHVASPTSTSKRVDGCRAPEVTDSLKVSQKADVYSFGVLLLELLTGRAPASSQWNEEEVDLPRWVQSVVKDDLTAEVFDLELLRYQGVEEGMVQLLQLALDCTSQHPDTRPSMAVVTARIEEICQSGTQDQELDDATTLS